MIQIKRDKDEPSGLKTAQKNHLKQAIDAFERFGSSSKEFKDTLTGYGSQATKKRLYLAQKKKCAWCERRRDLSSSPVEHYRPKNGAWRHLPDEQPERVDREHYWWLTWTWTNLLFSCTRCNDQGHKANYFPLNTGTKAMPHLVSPIPKPLLATAFDTSSEQPLLLDPSDPTVDPLNHIRWEPTVQSLSRPRDEWTWTPNGLTDIGKATIRILKLEELWEEVEEHLRTRILRPIERIEEYLGATPIQLADAQKCWETLLRDNLAPESELSAATWCALEIWMPKATRHANGLTEPRRPGS